MEERRQGMSRSRNILLRVFPNRRGQQSRVRIDIRARLRHELESTIVVRPLTWRPLHHHLTTIQKGCLPIFIIPAAVPGMKDYDNGSAEFVVVVGLLVRVSAAQVLPRGSL
jgi:hypothetical protein